MSRLTGRATSFPNGVRSYPSDSRTELLTATTDTLVTTTDSGATFICTNTSGTTITLPSIAVGNVFTIVNGAPDGTILTIDPAALDGIAYAGSSTDNKDLINTAATAKKGDYVTLGSGLSTAAWQVYEIQGVWAKEA